MKILLDNCAPRPLRRLLPDHEVKTAYECGWAALSNGELLGAAAASGFEVLLTVDQNIQYQQNLAALSLSVIVLVSPSLDMDDLGRCAPHLPRAIETVAAALLVEQRVLVRISPDGMVP